MVEEAIPTPLIQDKLLLLELRNVPEALPVRKAGDLIVYVQRWYRESWTLGPRLEVYLHGSMSIQHIATHLAGICGIRVDTLNAYLVDKLGADVPLYRLAEHMPSDNFYSSRPWFSPQHEQGALKNNKALRITEGDLLILQDTAEPLRELSSDELSSISAAVDTSLDPTYGTALISGGGSSSGGTGAHASVRYSRPAYGSGGGGVKIKTHKARMQDEAVANSISINSSSNSLSDLKGGSSGEDLTLYGPAPPPAAKTSSSSSGAEYAGPYVGPYRGPAAAEGTRLDKTGAQRDVFDAFTINDI
jgi:hypothetical protein